MSLGPDQPLIETFFSLAALFSKHRLIRRLLRSNHSYHTYYLTLLLIPGQTLCLFLSSIPSYLSRFYLYLLTCYYICLSICILILVSIYVSNPIISLGFYMYLSIYSVWLVLLIGLILPEIDTGSFVPDGINSSTAKP
jgi:hypothetical protein